jgi:hypothetical protein
MTKPDCVGTHRSTRFLAAIDAGLADADADRVRSHEQVVAEIRRRRARRAKAIAVATRKGTKAPPGCLD